MIILKHQIIVIKYVNDIFCLNLDVVFANEVRKHCWD